MIRGIAYILIFFFALQSCTIYNKTTVPIQDAVNKGKVKIVDSKGHPRMYEWIENSTALSQQSKYRFYEEYYNRRGVRKKKRTELIQNDSVFYGFTSGYIGTNATVLYDEIYNEGVYLKNKRASTRTTVITAIAIPVIIIGGVLIWIDNLTFDIY